MICADRTDPAIVGRYREGQADFLLCPSGGMFGSKSNDPIVQARSRENKLPIVFVHPAEFLATSPDGSIAAQTMLGDRLLVGRDEVGGEDGPEPDRLLRLDAACEEVMTTSHTSPTRKRGS